ncbi:hypothetical protein [Pandoravirus japonicus]|uniref:Uncharacterized protein n=1 Tax=Pandoravirus japonicus TaxID=2823154 RepID=A0A811BRV7_9VIRU|nr:hypothetical protein [Pandoravirus japonicus]
MHPPPDPSGLFICFSSLSSFVFARRFVLVCAFVRRARQQFSFFNLFCRLSFSPPLLGKACRDVRARDGFTRGGVVSCRSFFCPCARRPFARSVTKSLAVIAMPVAALSTMASPRRPYMGQTGPVC